MHFDGKVRPIPRRKIASKAKEKEKISTITDEVTAGPQSEVVNDGQTAEEKYQDGIKKAEEREEEEKGGKGNGSTKKEKHIERGGNI